jgi:tryptophanyl-tRNA synthetase
MQRVISGIQPTHTLTLGNYLGAIRQWIPMQSSGDCSFIVVDLHALTATKTPLELAHNCRLAVAAYLSCGIDPKKSTIFLQSHVMQHCELAWILNCITPLGWLNRMTQFKDKAGKDREKANAALYTYPVLMAADILLYKATHVPVGEDQKQHLELTRDIAVLFNHTFNDIFPLPEPVIMGGATRVMSLRDGTQKMSKSDPSDYSRINLTDSDDEIAMKIRKAKSDSDPLPGTLAGLENRPEAKNLITIYSALSKSSMAEILPDLEGKNFSYLKQLLIECLVQSLSPIRLNIELYMKDPANLDAILKEGKNRASNLAEKTMREVRQYTGLLSI